MGSLIMHLAVSNEIKRIYNFSDRFLFGSIMPDIKKRILNNRSISHYSEKIYLQNNSFKNLPNLEIYMKEHKEKLVKKDEYTLGYFAHLIQDRIWFDKYISRFVDFQDDTLEFVYMHSEGRIVDFDYWKNIIYNDYAKMEKYILDKVNLEKNDIVKRMLLQTNDCQVKETIKSELIDWKIHYDIKKELLTQNQLDEYFEECIYEIRKMYSKLKI